MGPGGLITTLVLSVLLATVVSRLLGVRLQVGRSLLVGLGGLAVGFACGLLVYYGRHPARFTSIVLVVGLVAAVLATMLLMVLAELFARPGRADVGPGLPHPWRALRRVVEDW